MAAKIFVYTRRCAYAVGIAAMGRSYRYRMGFLLICNGVLSIVAMPTHAG